MRHLVFGLMMLASLHLMAQEKSEFLKALESIEGVVVVGKTRSGGHIKEAYEIKFTQPVDHHYPTAGTFTQRIFVGHAGFDAPTVMSTSGYSARGLGMAEPAYLLKANLLRVEHRFFGESYPDPVVYDNLTVWQASTDHHRIYEAFKDLYPNKWVSTGVSKDGQTAMMYKAHYPDDMDVAIPYVAPLNTAKVDPRIYEFLNSVGTADERKKVYEYQIAMFEKKDEILDLVKESRIGKMKFTMGLDRGYDLGVLEFPFAMWQYGQVKPLDLPGMDNTPEELLQPFNRVNAMFFFSEPGIIQFLSHYYQAMNEMGYYGYDIEPFQKYLPDTTDITWDFTLTPYGLDTTFNPNTLKYLHDFVQNKGDHILYIYGEYDTWTATGVTKITGPADAMVAIQPKGYHGSQIRTFPEEQREKIYAKLSEWLGFTVPVK
jgi:hypothetical protein